MATCVLSLINQGFPDEGVACMVHTAYAPCEHNGEPANPDPIHGDDDLGRSSAIYIWQVRTKGQRPLLIHHGALTSGQHTLTADCWCKPEGPDVVEPHPWQEYNAHGNTCQYPGCRMTEDEHEETA